MQLLLVVLEILAFFNSLEIARAIMSYQTNGIDDGLSGTTTSSMVTLVPEIGPTVWCLVLHAVICSHVVASRAYQLWRASPSPSPPTPPRQPIGGRSGGVPFASGPGATWNAAWN
jgi:hypothetical protein